MTGLNDGQINDLDHEDKIATMHEDMDAAWTASESAKSLLAWLRSRADGDIRRVGYALTRALDELDEGYHGIAADFELCKAHLRNAAEVCAGTVNADTVAEWKRAASLPNASRESRAIEGGQNGNG